MPRTRRIGVLAIQGDYERHMNALERAGASTLRVRHAADLKAIDGLVIPGGESTTISKGLTRLGLYDAIASFVAAGHPILGTCAGAVLLARTVENHPVQSFGLIDVVAVRNAYGTQVDSFEADAADTAPGFESLRCVFIRAPQLKTPGAGVEVLARLDGAPVFVRQGRALATTFHPELTSDTRVHALLVELCGD